MRIPRSILEKPGIMEFLQLRGLIKQYKKSKQYFLQGRKGGLDLKERNPPGSGIWSFRINQKWRVFGYFDDENDFLVFLIYDHQ